MVLKQQYLILCEILFGNKEIAMKCITIKLNQISEDKCFRNDVKFHSFYKETKWNIFGVHNNNLAKLGDVLILDQKSFNFENDCEYKGIPTGQAYIDEDGDIIDCQIVTKDNHPNRLKYMVTKDNILLSSLRLARAPALNFDISDLYNYVFSNGFYVFKVQKGWNTQFVYYLLRSKTLKKILDSSIYRGIGISSYKYEDLYKVKIKNLTLHEQCNAIEKITPLNISIKKIKKSLFSTQNIIDEVFKRTFNFNYEKFEELKTIKKFNTSTASFSNNPDLRFSAKFHRNAGEFVMQELSSITTKKIKHYLAEPIILGASISPTNYSEDGETYYISMATIKNWEFSSDEAKTVSQEYAKSKKQKTVKKDDILIARSGEGTIGKVAIIEDDDIEGVFADFTMRVRLKDYLPKFAYYYFRTTYFQYLIEIYKKGLGNNTNIFPIVIKEFPVPDISIKEQERILDEIQIEVDKQNQIRAEILNLRSQIDKIIEDAITSGV